MIDFDCIVIGAGVIGLAVARAFARAGHSVVILEAERAIGTGVSSRSSEVIHAGLYYPSHLKKARLCVDGRKALYDFCTAHGVPHRRCGKVIVAAGAAELPKLDTILATARANGVEDLVQLDQADLRKIEPDLNGHAGLLSPSTGIIDSHAYMLALQGDAESNGAMLAFGSPVVGIRSTAGHLTVSTGGNAPTEIAARTVINSAGLGAQAIARATDGMPANRTPPLHIAKGNYYAMTGRAPFSHLIYPVPHDGGLGVHLTFDLNGQARFGPDVEWIEELDYRVNPSRLGQFEEAIRSYWPGLRAGSLRPDYAGIRPKIERPGGPDTDFMIQTEAEHGLPGLVNLFGIESPGLTSSLAIADEVLLHSKV